MRRETKEREKIKGEGNIKSRLGGVVEQKGDQVPLVFTRDKREIKG